MDVNANFRVRLNFVDYFDDVTVAMKNVALDFAAAVGHGFAAGEFTARFDVHVHERRGHKSRVNGDADGQRIIHRRAAAAEFFRKLDEELRDAVDEVVNRTVSAGELV